MKETELREAARCAHCQRLIGETRVPLFYRVTIERHGIDIGALQRQTGLAMMMGGNAYLASVMGPNEDMTKVIDEPRTITVCEECSVHSLCVAQLSEYANRDEPAQPRANA